MQVTKTQAERSLSAIRKAFPAYCQPGDTGPVLKQDWDDHEWVIIWEDGAPYDWPFLLDGGIDEEFGFTHPGATFPEGVHVEPVNHLVVALYRD